MDGKVEQFVEDRVSPDPGCRCPTAAWSLRGLSVKSATVSNRSSRFTLQAIPSTSPFLCIAVG